MDFTKPGAFAEAGNAGEVSALQNVTEKILFNDYMDFCRSRWPFSYNRIRT
jgi:hypothetical protein